MTLSSELLLEVATRRLRASHPELADGPGAHTPDALRRIKETVAASSAGASTVVSVVGHFSLAQWVRETCGFVLSLPAESAEMWLRSFTRTLFLAGQPKNLTERFRFDRVADDGSVAWLGPTTDTDSAALRRLLKVFSATREVAAWAPVTVEVPAPPAGTEGTGGRRPVHRDLHVAVAGLTVSQLLVQVNHLLAEAVLDGTLKPGDTLTLRSVPRLATPHKPFAALRVDTDAERSHVLRAYAGLTEET